MKPTRRQFMATSAVVGAGALAGCSLDSVPFIGGGGLGQYPDWVPAEDALDSEQEGISFGGSNPSSISGAQDNLHPSDYRSFQSSYGELGIKWADVSMDLGFNNGSVIQASFDTDEVTAELQDDSSSTEYTSEETHKGYEIYVQDSGEYEAELSDPENADPELSPTAYAVNDGGTVVRGSRVGYQAFDEDNNQDTVRTSAIDVAKGIIDAGEDGTDRAIDDDTNFETLTNELNDGDIVSGRVYSNAVEEGDADSPEPDADSGTFEDAIAEATSLSINGGDTERQEVYVFDGSANEGDLNDYVEAQNTNGSWSLYEGIEVQADGDVGIVTGTIDTYDLGR